MATLTNTGKRWQGSKWIRPDKRIAIYLRDKFTCIYCGDDVVQGQFCSLDHVTARSAGGSNCESNLVTCCKACNDSKNGSEVTDWAKAKFGARKRTAILKRILRQTQLELAPYRAAAKAMLSSPEDDE